MRDFSEDLADLSRRVRDAQDYLRIDDAWKRLAELEIEAGDADLWNDPDQARKVTTELSTRACRCRSRRRPRATCHRRGDAVRARGEEGDDSVEGEIAEGIAKASQELDQLELRALFSGEHDERDAICEIHSGAGGTDAQDWAEMLFRMFSRWAQRRGFDFEVDEIQEGQEAGITSATFIVKGRYAYGLLAGSAASTG